MNFRVNADSDIYDEILRIRARILRIWLFRALITGLLYGFVAVFLILIFSQSIHKIPAGYLTFAVLPLIFAFFWKSTSLRQNAKHIPEFIDKQMCEDESVLTSFELHMTSKLDSPFFKQIKDYAEKSIRNKSFVEFKVIGSAIELILLIFITLVTAVLLISSKSEQKPFDNTELNKFMLEKLVEIETQAQINNDKDMLKLIAETKQKLLNNEFNTLSTFLTEIDEKMQRRDEMNNQVTEFIDKIKDSEDDETLMKQALELAQKQISERNPEFNVQDEVERLMHLDLDEIVEILKKYMNEDQLLEQKLQAFIEKNTENNNKTDKIANNDESVKKDSWVYNEYKPAKVEIIKSTGISSIIEYHAITEKYSTFKHLDFRKRVIAELNATD